MDSAPMPFSQDFPVTQPDDVGLEMEEDESMKPKPWGSLLPISENFTPCHFFLDEYIIGRSRQREAASENYICIKDKRISGEHCKLRKVQAADTDDKSDFNVFCTDISTNGTYINGEALGRSKSIVLANNDKMRFSNAPDAPVFRFACEGMLKTLKVHKTYNVKQALGSGGCGEVFLGVNRLTGAKVAIKTIQKKRYSAVNTSLSQDALKEVDLMRGLQHPNIIQFIELFDEPTKLYIAMELAVGKDLFERISTKGLMSESVCRFHFHQLLSAVDYLHTKRIVHRDIKLENILCKSESEYTILKITDFNLSAIVGPESYRQTFCGTLDYQAPETFARANRRYDFKVDLWSLGVVLYICLSGYPPFADEVPWHNNPIEVQITKGIYRFDEGEPWDSISKDAKQLVSALLQVNSNERLDVKAAMDHIWMTMPTADLARLDALVDEASTPESNLNTGIETDRQNEVSDIPSRKRARVD